MSDSPRSVPEARSEPVPAALESWVLELASRARTVDGAPPFSDQAMVDYRLGKRELIAIDKNAAALVTEVEAEFVVDPVARGRGLGTRMLDDLLARGIRIFWAHGDHPAARALAKKRELRAHRELLHLSASVDPNSGARSSQVTAFRAGVDEDDWVALNAETFFFHPDQGDVSRADLEQLEREPWFSAENFLLLRRDGRMIGYCWLKVEDDRGEFYVVGLDPDHHGEKLGSLLFDAGLARLAELGIRHAHLYVEADNEPALALYRARGFTQDSIDIQYAM